MVVETPQGFLVQSELSKAAWDNGWRIERGEKDGWMLRESHDAPGQIGLAAAGTHGAWFLAVDHAGTARELGDTADMPGPGLARFSYPTVTEFYHSVSRAYDLAKALPDDPLHRFRQITRAMPKSTDSERLVVQRAGQYLFRDALLRFWVGRCPLTGISDPALLRASHMKPWAKCSGDAERLDVYNGLLLSALWDAAFDCHLVTFQEDGWPEFSPNLSVEAREKLESDVTAPISLSEAHMEYLMVHRTVFKGC